MSTHPNQSGFLTAEHARNHVNVAKLGALPETASDEYVAQMRASVAEWLVEIDARIQRRKGGT